MADPASVKRFYKQAAAQAVPGGWQVLLDGRGVKSVGGRQQIVPGEALALALAAEWANQGEEIDPARFILRDCADYAIDVVAPDPATAVAAVLRFAETDTLCYRADPDEPSYKRQLEVWEPLLCAAEARWQVQFTRISGVIHRPQPPATLARLERELQARDPFAMAALRNTASLAASLVIGLAALEPGADVQALWHAANLEETWQAEQWGSDAEAEELMAVRQASFVAAVRFGELSKAS